MDKNELKARTKKFAVDVILFFNQITLQKAVTVICNQVLRSSTSVGANYRAACKAKSVADFINKITICEEEANECIYWFEVYYDAQLSNYQNLTALTAEAKELTAIFTAIGKTTKANHPKNPKS